MIPYKDMLSKAESSLKDHCSLSEQEFNTNFGYNRTYDNQALNRSMVEMKYKDYIWHDHYPASRELVEGKSYNSITSDFFEKLVRTQTKKVEVAKICWLKQFL